MLNDARPLAWNRLFAALTAIVALGASAGAAAQVITEFPLATPSSAPQAITTGPDGALWFTEYVPAAASETSTPVSDSKIGRIAVSGVITEFPLPTAGSAPGGIVAGPDGALWFVESGFSPESGSLPAIQPKIGRITTDGQITEFAFQPPSNATFGGSGSITVGSDGALWFVVSSIDGMVGRMTTAGSFTSFVSFDEDYDGIPVSITAGPDGALWFTALEEIMPHQAYIGRLTTSGVLTSFRAPGLELYSAPIGITPGPDGALWYSASGSYNGLALGRVTTDGTISNFPVSTGGGPNGIAMGPDGALWYFPAISGSYASVGRLTTSGANTEFTIPSLGSAPASIVAGPDGAMWFTESGTSRIGRITVPVSSSPLVAAVLPSGRSVEAGSTATAYATIINAGTSAAASCAIAPVTGAPATFLYQTTIASNNALTGTPNTPVTIPAGGSQSFILAFTTTTPFTPLDMVLGFDCAATDAAESVPGLNTLLLSASATPAPDIIALSATPSGDGILDIAGDTGSAALAVATADIGAAGSITATADTGAQSLPIALTICQSDPATGQCLAAPASSVTTTIDANATPTFSVFATATGAIPFAPATSRLFVRFADADGTLRGATSVAVRSQ